MTGIRWLVAASLLVFAASAKLAPAAELLPADTPIHEAIDRYIEEKLVAENVVPAPQIDDANLIRRTMLDLVGRIPTVQEVRAFIESADPNKREQLVERLMASPAFVRHQANEFDTMLMAGNNGSLTEYLRGALQDNRPWDAMFRDMLLGDDSDPKQKGAIQFVKARVGDLDKLANEASVAFFGVNVSCAKCHDHPLVSSWTQEHFFGMKSFFSRTFDNGDFLGEYDYGIVEYKTTEGESRTAKLMFLTGTVVDEPEAKEPSDKEKKDEKKRLEELKKKKQAPPSPKFSRRAQLAEVALRPGENEFFAKSLVNRLWSRLVGFGFVMPVDQMHPENRPSHPELLEWLARDFISHDYDLRRLIHGMVLSRTYSRSSRWDSSESPKARLFAVGNVRPLSPYQYATSLRLAALNPDSFAGGMKQEDLENKIEGIENAARGLAGQFEQPYDDFQISVDEALLMTNSDRIVNELLRDTGDSLTAKLAAFDDRRAAIETAVWVVLSRAPDEEELQAMTNYLEQRSERVVEAYQQVVWALMTSSENRFNY